MYVKPDYELKAKILAEKQMLKDYKLYSKSVYAFVYGLEMAKTIRYEKALEISAYHRKKSPKEWKECSRISHAHYKRVIRLRNRITDMVLNADCLFLTFTFTDENLRRISAFNRRRYVQRYIQALNVPYVANIDFGKKKGREHYHALVGIDRVDYKKWSKKCGNLNGLKVRNETADVERLAKYVAKLTNHAMKETTKRCSVMYSRKHYVCIDRKYYEINKDGEIVGNDK